MIRSLWAIVAHKRPGQSPARHPAELGPEPAVSRPKHETGQGRSRKAGAQSPGAPQTGNQRLRSFSSGSSPSSAPLACSSSALSRFCPEVGANG